MKRYNAVIALGILLSINFGFTSAAEPPKQHSRGLAKTTGTGPYSTLVNINNVSMWIEYDGSSARNPATGNSGITFPRGTGTCIFSDGLVWGGEVHDGGSQLLRVNGQTYQTGCVGGAITQKGVAENAGDQSVRIYRIRRDWGTAHH